MMTRRQALHRVAAVSAVCAGASALLRPHAQTPPPPPAPAPAGPFRLPPLGYDAEALEPHIDAQTMKIHHDKHHATYVQNLNKAVADFPDLAAKSVEELLRDLPGLPEKVRNAIKNHGGGHYNHTLFWQLLKVNNGGKPSGELAKALDAKFGGFTGFETEFQKAAMGIFGSGWAWLTLDGKSLKLETTPNQDTPLTAGRFPLLGLDVWEHAYYLKYQNRRVDYVAAFAKIIHWDFVSERYQKAIS